LALVGSTRKGRTRLINQQRHPTEVARLPSFATGPCARATALQSNGHHRHERSEEDTITVLPYGPVTKRSAHRAAKATNDIAFGTGLATACGTVPSKR